MKEKVSREWEEEEEEELMVASEPLITKDRKISRNPKKSHAKKVNKRAKIRTDRKSLKDGLMK